MNIGLIILLTSLFVGAEDNNDQPAEIKNLILNVKQKMKMLNQFYSREITHILVNLMVKLTGRVTSNS